MQRRVKRVKRNDDPSGDFIVPTIKRSKSLTPRCSGGIGRHHCSILKCRVDNAIRKLVHVTRVLQTTLKHVTDVEFHQFLTCVVGVLHKTIQNPPKVSHVCQVDDLTRTVYDWPSWHGSAPPPMAIRQLNGFVGGGPSRMGERVVYLTGGAKTGETTTIGDACTILHENIHILRGGVDRDVDTWLSEGFESVPNIYAREELLANTVDVFVSKYDRIDVRNTLADVVTLGREVCERDYSDMDDGMLVAISDASVLEMLNSL